MQGNDPTNRKKGIGLDENSSLSELPVGKSWFFGIGINEYLHFQNLNNAKKDIEDLVDVLKKHYELDETRTLFNQQATRNNIIDTLQELQDKVGEHDKLIIYYSGHGFLDKRKRGYWLSYEAEKRRVASYLRNSTIREFTEDINARHILLISDSCFSGSLLTRNVEVGLAALDEMEKDRSRWVIASGRQQETVADGKPGTNSPFTASILQVLRKNQDAGINAAFLFDQVSKLTRFQYDQMPQSAPLIGAGHKGGQYVFRLKVEPNHKLQNFRSGQFTDPRDNRKYQTIEINGLTWMAENLSYDIGEGCSIYKNRQIYEKEYGRLYTWQAAKDACPPGWRLPSLEEWDQLCDFFGKTQEAFQALIKGGHSGFNACLGGKGSENGRYIELEEKGYFWTGIEKGEKKAVDIAFVQRNKSLPDGADNKSYQFSCRCVQINTKTSFFTDPRDSQIYKTVELNGLRWMAQNLNFDIGNGCWAYDYDPNNEEKYGRLYTWEAAEKACPPGWRLPTDKEWQGLAKSFGGYYDWRTKEDYGNPQKAYSALATGGLSGFSVQFGGDHSPKDSFRYLGERGFYWSATQFDKDNAWYYYFNRIYGELNRFNHTKSRGFSCRCVQVAPSNGND